VITIGLSAPLGPTNLLLVAALFLEAAVFCVHRLDRHASSGERTKPPQRIGGGAFAALPELLRSPYLLGIAAWVSLLSFGATIAYFAQVNIVSATVLDRAAQTQLFAGIDLAVGLLSLATQVFATGRFLKRFGTGIAAAALPAVYVIGFGAVAVAPTLVVVVTLQVVQRWMNFAVANPARQVFFTVVGREEKYKAKNLIDVVVYRGSDALYGWVYDALQGLGLKLGGIALCTIPIAAAWLWLSAALGRAEQQRAMAAGPVAAEGD
jgi:AAA family ATP:ADP antiporter